MQQQQALVEAALGIKPKTSKAAKNKETKTK
jgi:hypothetical protein